MGLQSYRSLNFENFRTPNLGVLGQNNIWVQAPWLHIKNIIRGKVVASPKSGPWSILWVCVCLWRIRAPKVALINLLFSLCKSMWIIDPLVIGLSPIPGAPTLPYTPEMLWTRERTSSPYPSDVFTFGLALESIKEFGGVSCWVSPTFTKPSKLGCNFDCATNTYKSTKISNIIIPKCY